MPPALRLVAHGRLHEVGHLKHWRLAPHSPVANWHVPAQPRVPKRRLGWRLPGDCALLEGAQSTTYMGALVRPLTTKSVFSCCSTSSFTEMPDESGGKEEEKWGKIGGKKGISVRVVASQQPFSQRHGGRSTMFGRGKAERSVSGRRLQRATCHQGTV